MNTENGDFTQSTTDLSVPTFGPSLGFSRTYDALLAQRQTQAGTPGPLGYGWTDNWATSLTTSRPVPGDIYTLSGLGTDTGDGGPAASAPLNQVAGVVVQGGNTYIADLLDNRVQEIAGSTGTQWGISMTAGDVYTIAGSPTGVSGDSPNGTAASASLLNSPETVALDPSGNLYIADAGNNRVVEIPVSSGSQRGLSMTADDVYTVAGSASGASGTSGDGGSATSALLDVPSGIAFAPGTSDLYISDYWNQRVQEVPAESGAQWGQSMTQWDTYTVVGSKTGVAGDSGNGTAAASALLDTPGGLSLAGGNLYVADTSNNRVIEVPSASGTQWGISMSANNIYTVMGDVSGMSGISGDGGQATSALLFIPESVTASSGQNLYIADSGNNRVQEVARTSHTEFGISMTANDVYTIAGDAAGNEGFSGDGGQATSALLGAPGQVALDSSGNLWIADTSNFRVREVSASTADISTVAGDGGTLATAGDGGPGLTAALSNPDAVTADSQGNVYIADSANNRVQEIAATSHVQWGIHMTAGDVYTVAGNAFGASGYSGDGGLATQALLDVPLALAVDNSGNLYIADSSNNRVQEVAAASGTQRGIAMTAGDIYTVAGSATGASGLSGDGGPATSALLSLPWGVAVDSSGDIYIPELANNRVQEVAGSTGTQWGISMTAGDMYSVAGSAVGTSGDSGDGGPATSALLSGPTGVALDPEGNLYISDGNNRVVEVAKVTGPQRGLASMTARDIYTVAGNSGGTSGTSGDGGPATSALLFEPAGIAVDAAGDLFINDSGNSRIQEVAGANGTQWGVSMTANDVYTIVGSASGTYGSSGDGGPATSALLDGPTGMGIDPSGNVFITDNSNNKIRELTATSDTALGQYPAGPGVTVNQANGSQVTFYPQSGGTCTAPYQQTGGYCALPQDVGATLSLRGSTYTYAPSPGTSYTYNSAGQLTGQADPAGNTLTVQYGTPLPGSGNCPAAASWCELITAANGRTLTLGYNASSQVTSVTDPMGRQGTYGYTGSDLTSATDPVGNKTSYIYGSGATGNPVLANDLLTITSPNAQPGGPDAGDSTVNVYDSLGRVTSQSDPMGFKTTFNYCVNATAGNCMNASTGTGYVTTTDPDGNTTVYSYVQGVLTATSAWTGGTSLASERDFFPNLTAGGTSGGTLLDTATADGNGNVTTYSYDASGNETSSTSPDGVGSQSGTMTAQSTSLNQPSCTGTAVASSPCSSSQTGPAPVAPGGAISPPSSAPPAGVTYTLYDTSGNELYSTAGVYQPGSNTASYSQTTYQLFKGDSVTLNGNNISCSASPPALSLPCATINADGAVTQLAYDAQGDLVSSSAPDGNGSQIATTTYTYNGDGQQTSVTSPDGNLAGGNAGNFTTVTAYNSDGQKTSVTQAGGQGATVTPRQTQYGYDANGNQTTVQDARGYTTTTSYNTDNQPVLKTDPDGNVTLTCYDGAGNVTQTVPPAGVVASNLTASSCPMSYPSGYSDRLASDATTYTFGANGDKTAMSTPAPAGQSGPETTTYTYDGNGNVLTTTSPPVMNGGANQVTANTYNSVGDLATQTTGYGTSAASTTSYCYDPNGNETSVVSPDGNASGVAQCEISSPYVVNSSSYPTQASYQTTYSYDSAGEQVSTTAPATSAAPNGATTTSTYDAAGNTLTRTDPDGVTVTSTYTPLNKPATVTYSGGSAHSVSYGYDASGNKTSMSDATGSSSYAYDPFGEVTSETNGAGQVTGYGYNADGQVSSITYPLPSGATWATSDTVGYTYDHADLRTQVTDFNGNQITIGNTPDGLPSSVALGSTGDTLATTYDSADGASAISLKNATSTLQSFTYTDSPAGTTLKEADTPPSPQSPAVYTYDAKGRVTSMTPGTGSTLSYGFDASGNLTTLPAGATGSYDNAGEFTSSSLSGATTAYAYNADGQRLTSKQGSATVTSGTWNGAGQLTAYTSPAAAMTAASYNGNTLRATATTGGTTQQFTWDTSTAMPRLLMDSASAYVYAGGRVPAEQVSLSTGTVTYLVTDSLGSVRGTVNSSGTLTGTTSYDAWGNPQTTGGLTATTPLGYAGGYTDPTGLIYLINRYYDPATGQFTSLDPLVAQSNAPYTYANGNPVSNIDPTGAWYWDKGSLATWGGYTFTIYGFPIGVPAGDMFISAYLQRDPNYNYVDVYELTYSWGTTFRLYNWSVHFDVYAPGGAHIWHVYTGVHWYGAAGASGWGYVYNQYTAVAFPRNSVIDGTIVAENSQLARWYTVNPYPHRAFLLLYM
ncbi:MAG TPA: RHS repeat-associated core domain-containing protein [Streptosporangiaceae bacterium]|nr:RHS repeat-associated core domain-containing protein [Streptosporangiaceae bacterium]